MQTIQILNYVLLHYTVLPISQTAGNIVPQNCSGNEIMKAKQYCISAPTGCAKNAVTLPHFPPKNRHLQIRQFFVPPLDMRHKANFNNDRTNDQLGL